MSREAEYQRAYRAKKRAAGLCFWGGCNLVTFGGVTCKKHKKQTRDNRRKLERKRRAAGLCIKCGQPKP